MIAFGDVARRIVGKPVQQVLRSSRSANNTPPDIAAIVSLKFTLAVTLTEQSYYNPQKSYQVNSVVTAYGRQHALPHTGDDQQKQPATSQIPIHSLTYPTSSSTHPTSQTLDYPISSYAAPPDPAVPSEPKSTAPSPQPDIEKVTAKNTPPDAVRMHPFL